MAFAISIPISRAPLFGLDVPFFEVSLPDQTASIASQNAGVQCRWFSALIFLKTYVVGTATVGIVFKLRAASVTGMTTNLTVLSIITADNVASSTEVQTIPLFGVVQSFPGLQFCDVTATFNGTSTGTFDVLLDACP